MDFRDIWVRFDSQGKVATCDQADPASVTPGKQSSFSLGMKIPDDYRVTGQIAGETVTINPALTPNGWGLVVGDDVVFYSGGTGLP